jgi:hypothetical protein
MVDPFADRGRVVPLIETRIQQAGPISKVLLNINYLWLDRTRAPRPVDYQLVWEQCPGSGPDVWQTWSPSTGTNHTTLRALH